LGKARNAAGHLSLWILGNVPQWAFITGMLVLYFQRRHLKRITLAAAILYSFLSPVFLDGRTCSTKHSPLLDGDLLAFLRWNSMVAVWHASTQKQTPAQMPHPSPLRLHHRAHDPFRNYAFPNGDRMAEFQTSQPPRNLRNSSVRERVQRLPPNHDLHPPTRS